VKPYAKSTTRPLVLASLLVGVAINGAGGDASGSPVQASDEKRPSGIVPARPRDGGTRGEELYQASCNVCHGPRAEGGVGPKLAGNPILSNDQAFWRVVHEGRHVMPPLKGTVSDQQLNDIRAWLRTLP
jgi:mono/diheme cytochrome c family protein